MWSDPDALEAYLESGQLSGTLGAIVLVLAIVGLGIRAVRFAGREV